MAAPPPPPKRPLDLDPDYQEGHDHEQKRLRVQEATTQAERTERLRTVLQHELSKELAQKEKDVMEIQERIHMTQRMLHLLRYAVVSDYYRRVSSASLATPAPASATSSSSSAQAVPQAAKVQRSLHPAVKKLLGRSSQLPSFDLSGLRSTRRKASATITSRPPSPTASTSTATDSLELRHETGRPSPEKIEASETTSRLPRYVPPSTTESVTPSVFASAVRQHRHKIKKRLVIGNISKWIPVDVREDAATHKWMVYVRGPKLSPDISDFVSRVRFFLHPSYRPHDVVDVTSPPFHLNRRGWGEFPVRVQVHFSLGGNRPVELIHQLKLDTTCTGLQTLGSETVVDVWLMTPYSEKAVTEETNVSATEVTASSPVDKGKTLYSDGENKTVAHDDSVTLLPTRIKQEPADDEEPRQSLQSRLNGVMQHFINDHDYFGVSTSPLASPVTSRCSSPSQGRTQDIEESCQRTSPAKRKANLHNGHIKVEDENSQSNGILNEGNCREEPGIEPMPPASPAPVNGRNPVTSLVRCIDSKGKVVYISLLKPKTSAQKTILLTDRKEQSCESDMQKHNASSSQSLLKAGRADGAVQKPFSIKNGVVLPKKQVATNASSGGRSLLKKNYVAPPPPPAPSPLVDIPPHVQHPPSTSPAPSLDSPVLPAPQPFTGRTVVLGRLHGKNVTDATSSAPKVDPIKEVTTVAATLRDAPEQAIMWVLRQLPLADRRADSLEFRRQYTYCARNVAEFLAWPIPKQRSAEWVRAKAVQRILRDADVASGQWSARHIVQWGRLHGLTPMPPLSRGGVGGGGGSVRLPLSGGPAAQPAGKGVRSQPTPAEPSLSEPSDVLDWLDEKEEIIIDRIQDTDEDVDIVTLSAPSSSRSNEDSSVSQDGAEQEQLLCIPSDALLCGFVRDRTRELGLHLEPEALLPGVLYPAAERLILRAMFSLCEDLLRRSTRQAWSRCHKQPDQITPGDVRDALLSRDEFNLFTNWGLGVPQYDTDDC